MGMELKAFMKLILHNICHCPRGIKNFLRIMIDANELRNIGICNCICDDMVDPIFRNSIPNTLSLFFASIKQKCYEKKITDGYKKAFVISKIKIIIINF